MEIRKRIHRNYIIIAFLFIIIKLWLVQAIPVNAIGYAGHDDRLFLKLAQNILNGHWFGPYNDVTICKVPVYSFWLAFNFILEIPLLTAQQLLYALGALFCVYSFKNIIKRDFFLLIIFLLLLFNPYFDSINRVTRAGIYPSLLFFTIGFFNILRLKLLKKTFSNLVFYSFFAGWFLFLFWHTREESIWISPIIIFFIISILYENISLPLKSNYKNVKPILYLILPFFIFFLGRQYISIINYKNYKIYDLTDQNSKSYQKAFGALTRININDRNRYFPIPKRARTKLYEVSPTFKELEPYFESPTFWRGNPEADLISGVLIWAFRSAMADLGYFENGIKMKEFFEKIANEVNIACDNNLISCSEPRISSLPKIQNEDIKPVFESFIFGLNLLTFGRNEYSIELKSVGDNQSLSLFADLTKGNLGSLEDKSNVIYHTPLRNYLHQLKLKIFNANFLLYKKVSPFILFSVIICFLFSILTRYKSKSFHFIFFFYLSTLTSILFLLFILGVINTFLFSGFEPRYFSGLYPLYYLFSGLVIYDAWELAKTNEIIKLKWIKAIETEFNNYKNSSLIPQKKQKILVFILVIILCSVFYSLQKDQERFSFSISDLTNSQLIQGFDNIIAQGKNSIISTNTDPKIFLKIPDERSLKQINVKIKYKAPHTDVVQLFYTYEDLNSFSEELSKLKPIEKGVNEVFIEVNSGVFRNLIGELRLDIGSKEGLYEIEELLIYGTYN